MPSKEAASETTPLLAPPLSSPIPAHELGEHYGLRWFHARVICASLFSQLLAAMSIGTAPYLLGRVQLEFGVDDSSASLFATSMMAGSAVGILGGGLLCDRIGRLPSLTVCTLIITIGNLLHLLIPHGNASSLGFATMVTLRAFIGLPYGAILTVTIVYVIEFFPDNLRGLAATGTSMVWPVGVFISILFLQAFEHLLPWRVCLAVFPLPATLAALVSLCLAYESPRWFLVQGNTKEARIVLNSIFASPPICGTAHVGLAPEVIIQDSSTSTGGLFDVLPVLFGPRLRTTTVVSCLLYLLLGGMTNAAFTWGPAILGGVTGDPVDLSVFEYTEIFNLLGTVAAMATVDYLGRRPLLAFGYGLCCVTFAIIGVTRVLRLAQWLWLARAFGDGVLWAVIPVYMSEVFPTAIRGVGCGLAGTLGRVAAVLVPLIPASSAAMLPGLTIVCCFGVLVVICMPGETARKAIMDECPAAGDVQ